MSLSFEKLHPTFMAQASPVDLCRLHDQSVLEQIRQAMSQYGVLVFRGQHFSNDEQVEFARRLDGEINATP